MLDLAAELRRLNEEQQRAVQHDGNIVVLAGPGSGKTATLVVKVGHLLSNSVQAPRGVACITYSNEAVREFRMRLAELGIHGDNTTFFGTVHSFCLNCVLRPYAKLILPGLEAGIQVQTPKRAQRLLDGLLKRKYPRLKSQPVANLTLLRRRMVCHDDISGFPSEFIALCQDYRQELRQQGVVDFEEMVALALELMEEHSWIQDVIASQFPWVVVDEYQDLGGPLHRIVTQLVDGADVRVFAVGDPHQTIYPFAGADSKYLMELTERADFEVVRLRFNYRSGRRLILASQAALALEQPTEYEPDPDRVDEGEVYISEVPGGFAAQAGLIVNGLLPQLDRDVQREEIAILYRSKGNLLDVLQSALADAGVPYVAERDGRYPRSPFVKWLQDSAQWCISDYADESVSFDALAGFLHELEHSAGQVAPGMPCLELRLRLYSALDMLRYPRASLQEWLVTLNEALGLKGTIQKAPEFAEALDDLEQLLEATEVGGCLAGSCLLDFASEGRVKGKVVLTTLHSSKGRQFDAVIMPGLQETVLPERRWGNGRYEEPSPKALLDARRLFYVGLTRARKYACLLYSDVFTNQWGYKVDLGPSRFVMQVKQAVEEAEPNVIPFLDTQH